MRGACSRFFPPACNQECDIGGIIPGVGPATDDLHGHAHTERTKQYLALQEAFGEIHLRDLSDNYDFVAARVGNQVFNSDFRGFLFNDVNTAARVSGGFGALIPGSGFRDIYRRNTSPVPGYNSSDRRGDVDDFLYSAVMALTLTY